MALAPPAWPFAAALRARGVGATLLDREDAVGASWRARYEGLRLNTVRWLSGLPGLRMPRSMGRWVGRDDFVGYLERYAAHHRLRVQSDVTVQRIDRGSGDRRRWLVATDRGTLEASAVVVATSLAWAPTLAALQSRHPVVLDAA